MNRFVLFAALLGLVTALLLSLAVRSKYLDDCGSAESAAAPNPNAPKIIHVMYFPWDKEQRLKSDPLDFDQTWAQELARSQPDFRVIIWTIPRIREFLDQHYPGLWEQSLIRAERPTQLVDLYRWLVVYHFGGIYIQYGSRLKTDASKFLPSVGKGVRLFTAVILFPGKGHYDAYLNKIRKGELNPSVQIRNQLFSAVPRHPYLDLTWRNIWARMQTMWPSCDHDILFIGANAYIPQLYDQVGRHNPEVERISQSVCDRWFKVSCNGSWRGNHAAYRPPPSAPLEQKGAGLDLASPVSK
jgi:hypothetical protein